MLFYGGQIALNQFLKLIAFQGRIEINPFVAGFLTIGFVYGAYFAETFRGAILSVPKGQAEAGLAFGMGRCYVFRRIVFPQMVRFALPSFTNNWLVLVKSTALVSMLGLSDITILANQAGASARGAEADTFKGSATWPGRQLPGFFWQAQSRCQGLLR